MSVRKTFFLIALLFGALVALADGYILPAIHTRLSTQSPRTFTCEILKTDEGWRIIPNESYLNKWYWLNVCHSDTTFNTKDEAIHTLEAAGWTMIAPSPTDGNSIRFSRQDNWSASPQAIERWEEFFGNSRK